ASAELRPSVSAAQSAAARTKPIMMGLLGRGRTPRTAKNARKGDGLMAAGRTSENVASFKLPNLGPAGTGRPARYCNGVGPDVNRPPPDLVAPSAAPVRAGLGSEADFSYWQCYNAA